MLGGCSTFYIHPSNNRGVRLVRVALAFVAVLALLPRPSLAATPHVLRADLDGVINNITAAYVASEVSRAESDQSGAFLLVLNTPGGISQPPKSTMRPPRATCLSYRGVRLGNASSGWDRFRLRHRLL